LKAIRDRYPHAPVQLCVFHKYSRTGQIASFVRPKTPLDREIKVRVEQILFAPTKEDAIKYLGELEEYTKRYEGSKTKLRKIINVLKRNFDLLLTHYDHPEMSPYNNVLEGFNYLIKRRTNLMKGFKKPLNVHRWIKLLILDWRFHPFTSSIEKAKNKKSPLQLAGCDLPTIPNWVFYVRKTLRMTP
jgi:transposase-like protein